jgi:hypothetical protein
MKVIKKPIILEAVQFKGFISHELEKLLVGIDYEYFDKSKRLLLLDHRVEVYDGGWIIVSADEGIILGLSDSEFKKNYQTAKE